MTSLLGRISCRYVFRSPKVITRIILECYTYLKLVFTFKFCNPLSHGRVIFFQTVESLCQVAYHPVSYNVIYKGLCFILVMFSGGFRGGTRRPPYGPKFSQFHAVFRKMWQNHMLAPPLEGWHPLLREILDPPLMFIDVYLWTCLIITACKRSTVFTPVGHSVHRGGGGLSASGSSGGCLLLDL